MLTLIWLLPWRQATRGLEPARTGPARAAVPVGAIIGRWPLWSMSIAHVASNYGFYFLLLWLPNYLVKVARPVRSST